MASVHATEPLRVAPDAVRKLRQAGNLPAALVVTGSERLLNESGLRELLASLKCTQLDVSGCANLDVLSEHLWATSVHAARTAGREIASGWLVGKHLALSAFGNQLSASHSSYL